jgi:predicted permease
MVGVQVALSVVLLTGAGLFVQTLGNLARTDLGFDSHNLIQVELAARTAGIRPEQVPAIHEQLIERVAAVPGVSAVTMFGTPLYPPWATGAEPPSDYTAGIVGPDFFDLMRIPLVRGRFFTAADAMRTEGYSIVTESFARQTFPGEDAIGKRAGFGNLEVIGIVRDAKLDSVRWDVEPMVYRMGMRQARLMSVVLVRAAVDPETVMRPIQEAVMGVNPRLLVSVRTVDEVVGRSIARERLVAMTSAFFGVLGLALTGIGLFGVAAFAVARRTSELGLRIALGATPWGVIRESLRETMRVFVWGLVAGSVGAFLAARLAGRFISGLLFGLEPADWTNVAGAVLLMLSIAVAACVVPALRASRTDPLRAIKYE